MASETPATGSRPIGRPRIGPKVDFRIPEEVRDGIEAEAEERGVPVDEIYRDVLVRGWNSRVSA